MSYPYPYPENVRCQFIPHECDDSCVWSSFAVTEPRPGQVIDTPSGRYKVLAVETGVYSSVAVAMEHGWDVPDEGWFWHGVKVR